MRTLWIAGGLLLAVCLAGCSDDLPMAAQAEPAPQQSAAQAESRPQPAAEATAVQSETRQRESDPVQAERAAEDQQAEPAARPLVAEAEEVEEEESVGVQDSAASDLTEAPAVVVRDAEMRVRPGLAWGVSRRLAAGDEVLVLSRIRGWLHVRVDVCEGWVRSDALDLGEVDESEIPVQAAPPIVAEWQGVEYGVMGQSADAAEVRLLSESDEIVSAPKGEVTLLASDITLDDLPVLVGDETVVFPGDDFRAGQGKILPRADEWMWLPWGWLLAHNDEYIWQWRPETDELEFVRRPPGFAKFSPDGSHIAIANLCSDPTDECSLDRYLTLLPLDGSATVSLGALLRRAGWWPKLSWSQSWFHDLEWAANSRAVRMSVTWTDGDAHTVMSLIVHLDGRLVRFDESGSLVFGDRDCRTVALFPGSYPDPWNLYPDNTVRGIGDCLNQEGAWEEGTLVYSLAGEFLRFDVFDAEDGVGRRRYPPLPAFDELGSDVEAIWSQSQRHALVISYEHSSLWLFDADEARFREIEIEREAYPEGATWGRGEGLLSWYAAWHGDEKLAAMWYWGTVTSGGYVIDVANGEATTLEFWSHGLWSSLAVLGWSPEGTVLKIRFQRNPIDGASPRAPIDGLVSRGVYTSLTAFVGDDGSPDQFILSEVRDPRQAWSPNERWLVTTW